MVRDDETRPTAAPAVRVAAADDRAPGMRSFMRLKQRSSVLLPHPEGPMTAVISLPPMRRLMSRTAWEDP